MLLNKSLEYWESVSGANTAKEIEQQPRTWRKTYDIVSGQKEAIREFVGKVTQNEDYDIIFTGAGTSEFVGNSLVPQLVKEGVKNVKSVSTTDLVVMPSLYIDVKKPTLLVSFGRSGNSPESVAAVDVVNEINKEAKHLIITCNEEGKLAKLEGEKYHVVNLPQETNDLGFAMTSSFSNMLLTSYLIFSGKNIENQEKPLNELITSVENLFANDLEKINTLIDTFNFNRIVYLGDANLNGIAQESSLKMLELTAGQVVTLFNTPLGFRHGPKSIVNSETLTVVYLNNNPYARKYQIDIVKEMSAQRNGNQILVIDCIHDSSVAELCDLYIAVDSTKEAEGLLGINYIVYAQLISLLKSIATKNTPDNPWPSGMVNRVVKGVVIYDYKQGEDLI